MDLYTPSLDNRHLFFVVLLYLIFHTLLLVK